MRWPTKNGRNIICTPGPRGLYNHLTQYYHICIYIRDINIEGVLLHAIAHTMAYACVRLELKPPNQVHRSSTLASTSSKAKCLEPQVFPHRQKSSRRSTYNTWIELNHLHKTQPSWGSMSMLMNDHRSQSKGKAETLNSFRAALMKSA